MDDIAITYLVSHMRILRYRLPSTRRFERDGRQAERGSVTTETVIIVAGLAALALAVVAIIVAKVTAKAKSIPTK